MFSKAICLVAAAGLIAIGCRCAEPTLSEPAAKARKAQSQTRPIAGWQWTNPLPHGTGLAAAWIDGSLAVTVGGFGKLLRSADGGQSWSQVPSGTSEHLVDVQGNRRGTIAAAGQGGAVLVSRDFARTWVARALPALPTLHPGGPPSIGPRTSRSATVGGVWVDDAGSIFVSRATFEMNRTLMGHVTTASQVTTLYRSADGGTTWTQSRHLQGHLVFVGGHQGSVVAVGTHGRVARSADGGMSWVSGELPGKPDPITVTNAWLTGPTWVVATAKGTLLQSTDRAGHWKQLPSPTTEPIRSVWVNQEDVVVVVDARAAHRSVDRGLTWSPAELGNHEGVRDLVGQGHHVVAVGESIITSDDSGVRWRRHDSGPRADLHDLRETAQHGMFVVGAAGTIMRSTDGGVSWLKVPSGTSAKLFCVHGEGTQLLAAGERGTLLQSGDGGASWQPIAAPTAGVIAGMWSDSPTIILATAEAVFRSDDGGSSWAKPTGSAPGGEDVWADDKGTVVVVGVSGRILLSRDHGDSFRRVATPTDQLLASVWGHQERIYAVGDHGLLLRSLDRGASWTKVSSGTQAHLVAVWGDGASVFAVGASTLAYSQDGGQTFDVHPVPTSGLQAVGRGADQHLVLAAGRGSIVRSR